MPTSTKSPRIVTSDSTVGTVAWSNPTFAISSNNTRATASLNNSRSEYLRCTDFDFDIPTNSIIDGIRVRVEKALTSGTGTLDDTAVHLVYHGNILSNITNRQSQGAAWTGDDIYSTYGSTTDLWEVPWTADDINSFDFGVVFSCTETASAAATAGIDHVEIIVSYTVGVVDNPRVLAKDEVLLFNQRYRLAEEEDGSPGKIRVGLATIQPPKIVTNRDYSRETHPFQSTTGGDSLSGGMGHWKYIYDNDGRKINASSFWTGQNIDTLWPRAVTLGPLATATTASAGLSFHGAAVLGNTIATLWSTAVYTWDGTTFTLVDTMSFSSANSQSPTVFNSRLFYPMSGLTYGYAYQTTAGGAITQVVNANSPAAVTFSVWDDKLYTLDTGGVLHVSTTGDASSWQTLARVPGGETTSGYAARRLLTFPNGSGEVVLHAVTLWGLYAYDAENDRWFPSNFNYIFKYPAHVYKLIAGRLENKLFVSTGVRDVWMLEMIGGTIAATNISLSPVPSEFELEIVGWAWDNQYLYVLLSRSALDNVNNEAVLVWNGEGWHPIRFSGAGFGGDTQRRIATVTDSSISRLIYGISNSAGTATTSEWINLHQLTKEHPQFSTTRTYAASGVAELPYDDLGYPEQVKTAHTFRLKISGSGSASGAAGTETVQVAYRTNYSTGSYTNLGSAVAVNEEVKLRFGDDEEGLDFKSIQFRFTLARGATTTKSPIIEYWALDCVRKPEILRSYFITIDAAKPYKGKSPQRIIDNLWSHMNSGLLGTFAWLDDNGAHRSSLVRIITPQGEEGTGSYPTGRYSLQLIECGR